MTPKSHQKRFAIFFCCILSIAPSPEFILKQYQFCERHNDIQKKHCNVVCFIKCKDLGDNTLYQFKIVVFVALFWFWMLQKKLLIGEEKIIKT